MPRDDFLFSSARQANVFTFINDRYQRTGQCVPASAVADYLKVRSSTATRILRAMEADRKVLVRRWRGCYQPVMPLSDRVRDFLGLATTSDAFNDRFKHDWESK